MVPNSDLQRWQQAINRIAEAQNDLSFDELSAFNDLVALYNNGNFETNKSRGYIQALKNSTTNNRLLKKVLLPDFIMLCEKYFQDQPFADLTAASKSQVEIPVIEPLFNGNNGNQTTTQKGKNSKLLFLVITVIILLIGGWWVYNNWESDSVLKVRKIFGLEPSVPVTGSMPNISAEVTVGKMVEVTGVTLDQKTLLLYKGDSVKLNETVLPENATNKTVKWFSYKPAVAKVDSTSGVITAVALGETVITATAEGDKMASCTVTVIEKIIPVQLNDLLNKIRNSDDNATDKLRKLLGNSLRVEGAINISNVQQLITDVSNGGRYKVTKVNLNDDGKIVSISVSK